MKVLIVEDEVLLAMNIQMSLELMGYQVVGISNSSESALEVIQNEIPDVILMDIVIQGSMNGIELTKVVTEKYPQCKVIYMTAHSDETTIKKAKQTRHAGIVNKPFEIYKLKEVLDAALK
jgi:DNA-binding NarL/FixJ family response regulator